MKALTLYQPWATLVAIGAKRIETRSWKTDYRGPLAIHVSKRTPAEFRKLYSFTAPEPFRSALMDILWKKEPVKIGMFGQVMPATRYTDLVENLNPGCVIAVCTLVSCEQIDGRSDFLGWQKGMRFWENSETERAFGDYTPGRWAWFLDKVKILPEAIPARGAMGLWEFDSYTLSLATGKTD